MEIKTKYDVGDIIEYRPDPILQRDIRLATITTVSVVSDGYKTRIFYRIVDTVNDSVREFREKQILGKAK